MYVNDLFKIYQKEVLNSTNKKDYYKTIFAQTKLFDMSNFNEEASDYPKENVKNNLSGVLPIKEFNLPFGNCFIKICDRDTESFTKLSVFINEQNPNLLSGELVFSIIIPLKKQQTIEGKLPFIINIEENQCKYSIDEKIYNMYIQVNLLILEH